LPELRKFDVVGLKNRISDLLTPKQTAELLHTTPGVLAVWRSKKRYPLRYVRIGTRIYYRAEDVQAFIELRTDPGVRQ
jgi:Helix-turn-helix domain